MVVHGDDFTLLGSDEDLNWFEKEIKAKSEVMVRRRLGPGSDDFKFIRILNRTVEWTKEGVRFEADQRHPEILIRGLLSHNSNSVVTPGVKDSCDEENTYLSHSVATMYRKYAARANFLAQDRPEMQYAVKECCRGMAHPTQDDDAHGLQKHKRTTTGGSGAGR